MILLCGAAGEAPIAMVRNRLRHVGLDPVVLDQRQLGGARIEYEIGPGGVTGRVAMESRRLRLEDVTSVYNRLLRPAAAAGPAVQALLDWMEVTDATVVAPRSAMGSNAAKPYQLQLIAALGWRVPETIVTNDPDLVLRFLEEHGRVVYKSMSGVRSVVRLLDQEALRRLERIMWCPTQFQAYVEGDDLRVHVVGDEVFACGIRSTSVDYRYAHRDGGEAHLYPATVHQDLADRCRRLTQELGLLVAGIDLKIMPSGDAVCLEVNPSPAFSFFESRTGHPISRSIADLLRRR